MQQRSKWCQGKVEMSYFGDTIAHEEEVEGHQNPAVPRPLLKEDASSSP
jgi:hypothetical protein